MNKNTVFFIIWWVRQPHHNVVCKSFGSRLEVMSKSFVSHRSRSISRIIFFFKLVNCVPLCASLCAPLWVLWLKWLKLGYMLLISRFYALILLDSWTMISRLPTFRQIWSLWFLRGGVRVWSTRWFLDLETSIFELLGWFYLLIPIFRLIRLIFHFSGAGRGRGRSFGFWVSGLQFS